MLFRQVLIGKEFQTMVRKTWSFKEDRRLVEIARSTRELDKAAKLMERPPETIKKRAMRLGLSFKPKASVKKARRT
jgi:hypothetical protein